MIHVSLNLFNIFSQSTHMQAVKHVTKKYIFTVEPFLYGLISEQNNTIFDKEILICIRNLTN